MHGNALLWAGVVTLALISPSVQGKALEKRATRLETGADGTQFIWTIEDTYAGQSFFE